ncbi:hypothetical protein HKD37_19G053533 [Glycine soja]
MSQAKKDQKEKEDTICNSHVISKYASMIVVEKTMSKPHSLSLIIKQSIVYRYRNLKQRIMIHNNIQSCFQ